ncbi:MAG: carbohydrate binding family 9 domain-containing protein [Acidobacteriota bacterium]
MTKNSYRFYTALLWRTLVSTLICMPLAAEDTDKIELIKISNNVEIDGKLDDPEWQVAPSIQNLVQVEPNSGQSPSEVTKVWLAYSSDSLYIAVRCEDTSPERIVATEMRRDAMLRDNDNVEIVLDTYHDHRNAYYFATNAAGAMVDGRISENQFASTEWDGIWNVRTHRDEDGWSVEFNIPFKTIGFNPGVADWGFNIS